MFIHCLGENDKDKKNLKDAPSHSNYYHKLQSVVKSSYNNYKVTIQLKNILTLGIHILYH